MLLWIQGELTVTPVLCRAHSPETGHWEVQRARSGVNAGADFKDKGYKYVQILLCNSSMWLCCVRTEVKMGQ